MAEMRPIIKCRDNGMCSYKWFHRSFKHLPCSFGSGLFFNAIEIHLTTIHITSDTLHTSHTDRQVRRQTDGWMDGLINIQTNTLLLITLWPRRGSACLPRTYFHLPSSGCDMNNRIMITFSSVRQHSPPTRKTLC